jgi:DNA-binding transcriptional regulator YbjK
MPPFNEARRDRLADAAMALLAREGARGLVHRAVDTEAGEPPGTTSRYFRTREALMRGVVERARHGHFADLARAPSADGPGAVRDALVGMVRTALTTHRTRHLAMLELFLESNRRPDLRAALTETREAQRQLIRDLHRRGGIAINDHQAAMLVNLITGIVFAAVTGTEDEFGLESILEQARDAIDRVVRSRRRSR